MATPVPLGEVNSLTAIETQDENALPATTANSPKKNLSSPTTATKQSPTKFQQLTIETGVSKESANTGNSSDNFSIDRYASVDKSSFESDSIHLNKNPYMDDDEPESDSVPMVSETPIARNHVMEKFDLLKNSSNQMMAKYDLPARIATPKHDGDLYKNKRLFEVISPKEEGVEVQKQSTHTHQTTDNGESNSYSSTELFEDIEQFRSADSHLSSPERNLEASKTPKILEQRIVSLMTQVAQLELEKDQLKAQKDDLQSKLNVQHEEAVEDMYQNPYSDPFATPTKQKGGMPSFLETATSNLSQQEQQQQQQQQPSSIVNSASMGGLSTSSIDNANNNAELHRELTELRIQNQSLQSELETAGRVKERLKTILTTVQAEDKQKLELITSLKQELDESKEREQVLKKDLDECKIRIQGFEIAQNQISSPAAIEERSSIDGVSSKPSSPKRKSFFSSAQSEQPVQQTGDVATALYVSQKQNEALEAFNKELETQNSSLQKKCDELTEKYGLKAPASGDTQGNQLYSRYLEAKASVSSLSVTLEEAQDENSKLTQKVQQLETQLQQEQPSDDASETDASAIGSLKSIFNNAQSASSSNNFTAEQEAALKGLVEKLEEQIHGYMEAEERHDEIRAQLEMEALDLRTKLEQSSQAPSSASAFVATPELERLYAELESKIGTSDTSSELNSELESLKRAMDAAAEESTKLLNELERKLASTREDLRNERTKFRELEAKHKSLLQRITSKDANGSLFEENEILQTKVSSLQKETQDLKTELEQKSIRIEKSEKRVATKHEQALRLTEANNSLRDGIHKLKSHLSTISEQAEKTEALLATTKEELYTEREKAQKLEVSQTTLQTKIDVLQQSIDGTRDEDSSQKIETIASLAATKKELSLEKERVEKLVLAKKELESVLDSTKEDLETQLHTTTQKNSELSAENSTLQSELEASKLVVAAASVKFEELAESKSVETSKLQTLVDSTRDLLSAEKAKSEGLKTLKTSLESKLNTMKQNVEELESSNSDLKKEMESLKQKATNENTYQFTELEKLLATTQEELNEEEQRVESLEKQVDDLTMKIEELEKCKSDLEVSLDDVKQEMKGATAKSEKLESLLKSAVSKDGDNKDAEGGITTVTSGERNATASTEVRLWEAEMLLGNTKRELKDALSQNESLTGKVKNLETSLVKSQQTNSQTLMECETHEQINKEMAEKIDALEAELSVLTSEKESLLTRTASLARRDQLQKASLLTSNQEMENLMKTISDFQGRFESLAEQIGKGEAEKAARAKEYEEEEAKWTSEKTELSDRIAKLQKKCDKIQKMYDELDSKHVQALMKEQSAWQAERVTLNKNIALLEKKDSSTEQQEYSSAAHYPLQQCATDRSLLNQKACELEQDIQLLEVTLQDKTQKHMLAAAELEEKRARLEVCEEELEFYKAERQAVVLKSATDRESFQGKIRELEEELEKTVATMEAAKRERDAVHTEREVTQTMLDSSKKELQRCQDELLEGEKRIAEMEDKIKEDAELRKELEALGSVKTAKMVELETAVEKQQDLQSKYDSCLDELYSYKKELKEKEEVMRELAKKQVEQKEDELQGRNNAALKLLADELNEAHIRENALEDVLSSCQKELSACRKKLEKFESQSSEEKSGAGVYQGMIAKLNRSNDSLTNKNRKLKEEVEAHKAAAKTLQKQVVKLQQENDIARVVAGGNNTSHNNSLNSSREEEFERENQMMKDLLATSQLSVTEAKNMQKILSSQVEKATKRETKLTKEILTLKARNEDMEKRLQEQEEELDEFENDFALARNDARKVVEELRSQLSKMEKRNRQLEAASGGLNSIEELKSKLKQLVQKNKRLEKEINTCRVRERRLESELGLEPRRCR